MKERGWSIIAERRKVTLLEEKAPELCLKLEGEFEGGDESVSLLEDGSYTVEVIFPPGCRDFSLRIGDEPIEALPFSVHIERGIAVGRLEMQNRLGDLTFELTLNGRKLTCTIKVRSRKLDYERHFEAMLSDLHRIAYNLRWDVLRAVTIQAFAGRPTRQPTPMEFLTILSSLFDRLFAALMLIARDPHHRLLREQVWCDAS